MPSGICRRLNLNTLRRVGGKVVPMKKILSAFAIAGALCAGSAFAALDGTITLQPGGGQANGGGAFIATTSGLGTFLTFCVEDNEFFGYGGVYNYRINDRAVAGGVGGHDGTDPYTGLSSDSLSLGTAWLYSRYRSGALFGGAGTDAQKNDLQAAIWFLEDEGLVGANNYLVSAASTGLGGASLASLQAAAGAQNYGVRILNLFDNSGNVVQDQLGIVPEPTTMVAGALLLLPFGASTLRILRKKS